MIQQIVVQPYESYVDQRPATLMVGNELVQDMITNFRRVRIQGTKGFSANFGKLTIALFPDIHANIGAAGDNGETLEELQRAIRRFRSTAPKDGQSLQQDYLNEVRAFAKKISEHPILSIGAECGV